MTDDERTAIRLAAAQYRYPAVRETHAMEQLGLTPTRYWALVGRLIDRGDVLAEMPVEVGRLRRLREARRAGRGRKRTCTHKPVQEGLGSHTNDRRNGV